MTTTTHTGDTMKTIIAATALLLLAAFIATYSAVHVELYDLEGEQ